MTYVNTERAIVQCEDIYHRLVKIQTDYECTDIHALDDEGKSFDALMEAIEAFRKLRNGL